MTSTATATKRNPMTFDNQSWLDEINLNVEGYTLRIMGQSFVQRGAGGKFVSAKFQTKYSISNIGPGRGVGPALPSMKVTVVNLSEESHLREDDSSEPIARGTVLFGASGCLEGDDLRAIEEASAIARGELERVTGLFNESAAQ